MLIEKWLPLLAPDMETGADVPDDGGAPPPSVPMNERPVDGPGSGRSNLRKDLEGAFERGRKADDARDQQSGQFTKKRRAGPNEAAIRAPAAEPEAGAAPQEGEEAEAQLAAPEAFSQEAKAEWAQTPPNVQAAILKREQDSARGVQELRQKYSDIDQALQPRMDVIKRHGHTPGQAVNQLFLWFEALSNNPKEAFPALMQSFRIDPRQVFQQANPQQQTAPAQQAAPQGGQPATAEAVPPAVQTYIQGLEQKLGQLSQAVAQKIGTLETNYAQQSEAKTREILDTWATGKDYFEDVRGMMAQLIQSGAVPPLPNGGADLDKAYDMAMFAMPDVRAKVLAAQQAKFEAEQRGKADKEKAAQQAAADKARKASGSLSLSSPGAPAMPNLKGTKRGKSVRESINEALEANRA